MSQSQCGSNGSENHKPKFPEPKYNVLSIASFWWMNSLIFLGYKRALKQGDLYEIPHERTARASHDAFRQNWTPKVTPSITWPLFKANIKLVLLSSLFRLFSSITMFVAPITLDHFLAWVEHRDPYYMGYVFAAIMFTSSLFDSIITGQYEYRLSIVSMKMRSAVNDAIYQKCIRLSPDSKNKYTTGEITNLMSVDCMKLHELVMFCNVVWSAVLQLTIAIYLLWQQLGIACLAGVAVMLIFLPVTFAIGRAMRTGQNKLMKKKDERSKLLNQIFTGIKVIKLFGWEVPFKERVKSIRKEEKNRLTKLAACYSFQTFTQDATPIFVSMASLATYTLIDTNNSLTASKAFVSLALFNLIRTPLFQLPFIVQFITMFSVSSKRINDFLAAEEIDLGTVQNKEEVNAITVLNGSFKWSNEETVPIILKDLNLKVPSGKLVAVIGRVGCGKSSLLSAVLGEMYRVSGSVNVYGSLAYVPQIAWIQNKSLKDNVLFKKNEVTQTDEERYQAIISATALEMDISILPNGDRTEIGEKGINLSGGQKQRVALARAVYQDSDIYLLDDPLSAVDTHVGQHIFNNVIGKSGLLKNKTRILVTHNVNILPSFDLIVVMKDGELSEVGTYQELLEQKGDFSILLQEYGQKESSDDQSGDKVVCDEKKDTAVSKKDDSNGTGKLITPEKEEVGNVTMSIYIDYFKSAGYFLCLLVVSMTTISSAFNISSSIWLSKWAQDIQSDSITSNDTSLRDIRLQVYSGLLLSEAVTLFMSDILIFLIALRASSKLHNDMLIRVLRAPMSFFDTTPIGRILNRFTKDIDGLDVYMSFYIRYTMYSTFKVLVTITVISIQFPYFLLIALPLSIVYYFCRRLFIPTSRQLKRIEASTKSPIFSHFSETISGTACIKAFNATDQFVQQFEEKCDTNSSPWLLSVCATRWNSFRLDFIGNIIILSCVLLAVISQETNAARVGLSISYALMVTYYLNLLVRFSADLESNIIAAERVLEYTKIDNEAPETLSNLDLTKGWPQAGSIKFENYSARYRPELDLILKDVSFEVEPMEKVGIVGRTGAGKSSVALALFRLIEPDTGRIMIDGVDVTKIGLNDLRQKLTIIPQDPVLFSGTLRMNLDPFNYSTDDEIWSALEQAHMKMFVDQLGSGLNHEVTEGGENFSVGQRQLICLARALLRKSKILILDEATAAVDLETDSLLQKTIQEQFSDCTILTIAHRLNTVLDYNRTLVLDNGKVAEFDTPQKLMMDPTSIFYSMVKAAGFIQSEQQRF